MAEVVALPVDAAVQERDNDARTRHAQRGDRPVDTRLYTDPVESQTEAPQAEDQKQRKKRLVQGSSPHGLRRARTSLVSRPRPPVTWCQWAMVRSR